MGITVTEAIHCGLLPRPGSEQATLFTPSEVLLYQHPLATSSHGNVSLDSVEPAGAADNSDVPEAAMFQARSFGSFSIVGTAKQ